MARYTSGLNTLQDVAAGLREPADRLGQLSQLSQLEVLIAAALEAVPLADDT